MSDLISRRAALQMLTDNELERQTDDLFDGDLHRYKRAAQRIIAQLPSADKRGKWIYLDGLDAFECSVCGRQMVRNIFNYCPNCGAKMERSEE